MTSRSLEPCFSRFDPKLAEKCHFHDNGCKGGNIGSGNTADGYFSLRTLTPRYPTPKMGIPKIWYHKSANLTRAGLLKKSIGNDILYVICLHQTFYQSFFRVILWTFVSHALTVQLEWFLKHLKKEKFLSTAKKIM